MANKQTHYQKFHIKVTLDAGTGVKGDINGYKVYGESTVRLVPVSVGGTNVVDLEGRLEGQTVWTTIGSVTGVVSGSIDISTYDYIRFNQTTSDGTGEVIVSGFFNQVGSLSGPAAIAAFTTIQTDAGTSPVADSTADTLTITSSDATITVTGDASTDTVDLSSSPTTLEEAYDANPLLKTNSTDGAVVIQDADTPTGNSLLKLKTASAGKTLVDVDIDRTEFNQQVHTATSTLADAASIVIDCNLSNVFEVTLAGNRTMAAPSGLQDGASYVFKITQDGTGSRTLAYNAVFKFPGGVAPVLSTLLGSVDILTGISDGTNIYCNLVKDFK